MASFKKVLVLKVKFIGFKHNFKIMLLSMQKLDQYETLIRKCSAWSEFRFNVQVSSFPPPQWIGLCATPSHLLCKESCKKFLVLGFGGVVETHCTVQFKLKRND